MLIRGPASGSRATRKSRQKKTCKLYHFELQWCKVCMSFLSFFVVFYSYTYCKLKTCTNSTNNSIPSLLFKEFVAMKISPIATSTPPVFFMIGCQRSGSNWLRTMLGEREDLIAPHPPHIMRDFIPILPKFGNLDDLPNLKVSNPFKLLAVLPATLTPTQEH